MPAHLRQPHLDHMDECACRAGGQKSKQEKKEAHKAKRKAKKGDDASAASAALLNSTPTAEALAAVGANQMSQAAAERQAQIDKNRTAWQQRTQAAASGAAESKQTSGEGAGPNQRPGDGSETNGAQERADQKPVEDDADGSTSSEEDEEVDNAGSGQVQYMLLSRSFV